MQTRCGRTLVIQVPALIGCKPRFGLDEHGQVSRMECLAELVLGHPIGYNRVEFNNTQFVAPKILVSVEECRVLFMTDSTTSVDSN